VQASHLKCAKFEKHTRVTIFLRKDRKYDHLLKHLNPVVFSVCHQDVALRVDCDALQALELTFTLTPPSETSQEGSIGVKNLVSTL